MYADHDGGQSSNGLFLPVIFNSPPTQPLQKKKFGGAGGGGASEGMT
jgi:hypothetical protein